MAPAIDTHNPIPLLNEVQHLRIPVVRAERPPVVEHNGLATAPVLIEDLSAVLGGDRAHRFIPRLGLLMPNLCLRLAPHHDLIRQRAIIRTRLEFLGRASHASERDLKM
jgi:hypothetical protein